MGWMVQLTVPGYLVAGLVFSLFHAGAALDRADRGLAVIGRPAAHTLVEALRFSFPFGGIPLATMGMSQVGGPVRRGGPRRWRDPDHVGRVPARGRAGGPGAPHPGIRPSVPTGRRRRTAWSDSRSSASWSIVLLSVVAPRGADIGEQLRIAAVQGGGEQGTSALEVPSSLVTERHLDATRTIPDDADLDLVLWPENTIDVAVLRRVPRRTEPSPTRPPGSMRRSPSASPRTRASTPRSWSRQTATSSISTSRCVGCRSASTCHSAASSKRLGAPIEQIGRDANAGTGPAYVDLPDGTRLGVVISWEVFFAGRAREGVKAGGEAILNPTNGASYTGTIVQTQQVASSQLRAIENGRWVVQAAPTGFTAIVDADGNVLPTHRRQRAARALRHGRTTRWPHVVHEPRRRPVHRRADRPPRHLALVHPPPPPRAVSDTRSLCVDRSQRGTRFRCCERSRSRA